MASFVGKRVIVAGGGGGIGAAVCRLLAREDAEVIVSDVYYEAAMNTVSTMTGRPHVAVKLDITKKESLVHTLSKFVPFNVVINAAGITRDNLVLNMTEEEFDEVVQVNLKGTFLLNQTAAKLMVDNQVKDGSIVNISSFSGQVGNVGQCNYAATKAGVEAITKTLAKELARYKIRCNAVVPGFIDTPMVESIPDKVKHLLLSNVPARRMGQPEEVAEVIAFLASDKASYVTGACYKVSGGI